MMFGQSSALLQNIAPVRHRFFGRHGGTSPRPWNSLNTSHSVGDVSSRVNENISRICFALGFKSARFFSTKQVHSDQIVRVTSASSQTEIAELNVDALFTTEKGILLGIKTADCSPILLASSDGAVVAAIHAGWRGTAQNIVKKSLLAICEATGKTPGDFVAAIGPSISFDKFEVGPEVVEALSLTASSDGLVKAGDNDKSFVNLNGFLRRQLEDIGVKHIDAISDCTFSQNADYFSHRADHGKTGRQLSVIGIHA